MSRHDIPNWAVDLVSEARVAAADTRHQLDLRIERDGVLIAGMVGARGLAEHVGFRELRSRPHSLLDAIDRVCERLERLSENR